MMDRLISEVRQVWLAVLAFVVVGVGAEGADERNLAKELASQLPGFFGPQTMPTEALEVERLVAEWDPASMLLVSIPLSDTLRDPRIFAFYFSLIDVASRYVEVGILHELNGERMVGRFLKRLEEEGMALASLERVHFLQNQTGSSWVRDFGPLFGVGAGGGLVVFDNIYRSLADEKEAWSLAPTVIDAGPLAEDEEGFQAFRTEARRSEVSPLFVAKFLREHYQFSCDVVRPPLHLQGGDYIADGMGRVYISEDTVLMNGGRLKDVERVFTEYYGADELLVLNALPGTAAKHLDLLLCHARLGVFILTEPPAMVGGANLSYRRMVEEVRNIQKANEAYLLRNQPEAKIYRVPMPPLVSEDSRRVRVKARSQIFAYVCEEIGIDYLRYVQLPNGDPQRRLVQRRVMEHLGELVGKEIDFENDGDFDLAAKRYLGADLATLIETNVDAGTIYRSYVNSVQIVTEEGRKLWLLPRYRAREGESVEAFAAMEAEVERVYRLADPGAILEWIDADAVSERMGAIHCLAMTLPQSSVLNQSTRGKEF